MYGKRFHFTSAISRSRLGAARRVTSIFKHPSNLVDMMDAFGGREAASSSANGRDPNEHKMGTTIMAVAFNGGVVVGADSRTSTGAYVANRVSDKLTPVHDRIFCCRSGSASDTQAVADIVAYYLKVHSVEVGEPPLVKTAANLFKELVYKNKDRLLAGIICAGWDRVNGGTVWTIPLGGALVQEPYSIGGSGSTYITGYCDSNFKKNMTKDECVKFVTTAISHAMSRDGSSGGVIRLAIIDEAGVERRFVPGDALPVLAERLVLS